MSQDHVVEIGLW